MKVVIDIVLIRYWNTKRELDGVKGGFGTGRGWECGNLGLWDCKTVGIWDCETVRWWEFERGG